MGWRPSYPGERPTLGWLALEWIENYLIVPDGPSAGDPLVFTREQAEFVLGLYEVDRNFEGPPVHGRTLRNGRLIRRAVLSRSKGWGKSPLVASLCLLEALGPVVLDGWDADGQPVGREWHTLGFKPKVQIVAVSEDQTANTWDPILEMAREGPVFDAYEIEPLNTMVNVPRGLIEAVTSSGTSREGFRPVFSAMDQTESWIPSLGGPKLAATIRRNLGKVQGCSVETPNAFEPGADSVAEKSFAAEGAQAEGRTKISTGILFDHREAPPDTDPADRSSLLAGLAFAYGDSADVNGGWVNLDRLVAEYWDPDTDPQDARRFYLNQITHAPDSFVSQPEWAAITDATKIIADRDQIVLGFDGSRGRAKGKPDATALIAFRVEDRHAFEVGVWEAPNSDREWAAWEPPLVEIEAAIEDCFRRFDVAAFYCDPAKDWRSHVNSWEARYGSTVTVKVSQNHPFEWWMSGGRTGLIQRAVEQLDGAIRNGDITHDGSYALTRHVLNARRRTRGGKLTISKEHDYSPNKIDAAVAMLLAYQACLEVAAQPAASHETYRPRRLG